MDLYYRKAGITSASENGIEGSQITVTPQDSNNDPFDSDNNFELFLMYNFAVYVYFHNIQYYHENLSNSIIKNAQF